MKKRNPQQDEPKWKQFWRELEYRKRTEPGFRATFIAFQLLALVVIILAVLFVVAQKTEFRGPQGHSNPANPIKF